MSLSISLIIAVYVTLFVIMDPTGTIPVFMSLTGSMTAKQRNRAALTAVGVAALVIALFSFFGQSIMAYMNISIPALQFSGGLLLLIVALQLLNGKDEEMAASSGGNVALVPLGIPLLAGPGAIVAMMLYVSKADGLGDYLSIAIAFVAMLLTVYAAMRFAGLIARILRDDGVMLVTRISGILLAAISVQMVMDAVHAYLVDWGIAAG